MKYEELNFELSEHLNITGVIDTILDYHADMVATALQPGSTAAVRHSAIERAEAAKGILNALGSYMPDDQRANFERVLNTRVEAAQMAVSLDPRFAARRAVYKQKREERQ